MISEIELEQVFDRVISRREAARARAELLASDWLADPYWRQHVPARGCSAIELFCKFWALVMEPV